MTAASWINLKRKAGACYEAMQFVIELRIVLWWIWQG